MSPGEGRQARHIGTSACAVITRPGSLCAVRSSTRRRSAKVADAVIGVLYPGEMGAAVGAVLRTAGCQVLYPSSGRSVETLARGARAGLQDVCTLDELVRRSTVILSVCPPHVAVDVARSVIGFDGVFVDANAVSPATSRRIGDLIEKNGGRYVDAGLVGPPPVAHATTRMFLSGVAADEVSVLFDATVVETKVLSRRVGDASALKMVYAAWTKGSAALVLAIRAVARAEGVEDALHEEWLRSAPELPGRLKTAARSASAKGWRWVAEMEEIADTFVASGLPDGFHRAAAELYRRVGRPDLPDDQIVAFVLDVVSAGQPPTTGPTDPDLSE
jgi:3-hydroxyisobutyrate dehydrogenase-like beta-hydroxyacid dehydrogenase